MLSDTDTNQLSIKEIKSNALFLLGAVPANMEEKNIKTTYWNHIKYLISASLLLICILQENLCERDGKWVFFSHTSRNIFHENSIAIVNILLIDMICK